MPSVCMHWRFGLRDLVVGLQRKHDSLSLELNKQLHNVPPTSSEGDWQHWELGSGFRVVVGTLVSQGAVGTVGSMRAVQVAEKTESRGITGNTGSAAST